MMTSIRNAAVYIANKWDSGTHDLQEILSCKLMYVRARFRDGWEQKTILFYPEKPQHWHMLYAISHYLGYDMSDDPHVRYDAAVAFQDATFRDVDDVLRSLSETREVINSRCGDISKERVEKVFKEIFGYGLEVDPRLERKPYVKKSNQNGLHDGVVLTEPTQPESGFIYQRLLDNEIDNAQAYDIRTIICKDSILFCLYRFKQLDDRFEYNRREKIKSLDAVYSKDEQAAILRFCKEFGLDFGELDVIRDNGDRRIYIVDVNNTPAIMPRNVKMPRGERERYLPAIAHSFARAFLDYSTPIRI